MSARAGTRLAGEPGQRAALVLFAVLAACASTPAHAQSIVCCNQNIGAGGDWTGSWRGADCQEYLNSAPPAIARRMCQQRDLLSCINTSRCATLPPEDSASQEPTSGDAAPPPDPDRDGLEQGFYGPPPADPPTAPAAPPAMPRRLVYIVALDQMSDRSSKSFTAWLDRAGCPLPLDRNNRLADSAAAKHVVRGKVIRGNGRVRVEAEAQARPGGARLGPFAADATGEDAAAVAAATRALTEKMQIVCAR